MGHGGKTRKAAAAPQLLSDADNTPVASQGVGRRRLVRFGLVAAVVLAVCLGVPVALASQWFIKGTLDAGTGSACPACVVGDYFAHGPLGTLSGDDLQFERTLCRSKRAQLHEQATQFAKAYKEAAERWSVSPELSHGAVDGGEPENVHDGKASITVAVTHSLDALGGKVIARKRVT